VIVSDDHLCRKLILSTKNEVLFPCVQPLINPFLETRFLQDCSILTAPYPVHVYVSVEKRNVEHSSESSGT
jgi:hypothetical protein